MSIDEFLGKLEGVTSDGKGGWMVCCPAHDDHNPSMHVNVGADGRILVKCYAGCKTEDIVAALGLKVRDLMPEKAGRRGKGKAKAKAAKEPAAVTPEAIVKPLAEYRKKRPSKFVCNYNYQDESGATIFRVQRRVYTDAKGGKTFIQQHPNDKGGWDYGVTSAGVERVPFRLPRILAAGAEGKNVIVVEGEKDVIAIEKNLGVVATCNPGGAGKWEPGWGKYFKGVKGVLIVADNDALEKVDEKTGETKLFAVGQRHANRVERLLREDGFQGQIKKLVLPDVEGEKVKDFSDWVEARVRRGLEVGKSAFQEVLKTVPPWPKEWEWSDDADLSDLQRAQNKSARNTASPSGAMPGEGDGKEKFVGAGRFGRLSPRTPSKDERWYLVDFQMSAGKIARFEIGVKHFRFEYYEKADVGENRGEFEQRDIYAPVEAPMNQHLALAIGCMLSRDHHFKLSQPGRYALVSSLCVAWLRARGEFFADKRNPCYDTSLFFDRDKGVLYQLHSNEFGSFLATQSCVNRRDKTFEYVMSLVDDLAMDEAETPRVVPSKQWDRRDNVIYISNGDSRVCKISAGKAEMVQNGTDGIVFVRGCTLEPWQLGDGRGADPFQETMLFKNAAFEKESDRMNCRLWFLNLFACHTNKPILLVTGPARSGKTRLLQGMKQILGMREDGQRDDSVNDIDPSDKGLDSFWVIVDKGRFEIFDNYDSKIKWAENAFQTAATNGSSKRRELYKTKSLVTLSANSYIGVTSNNPIFTTGGGGLPDRIVTSHLTSGRKVSIGGELLMDILERRDDYMTWIVSVLKGVLADEVAVDSSINSRHPDYGRFAVKCGRQIGDEDGAIVAMEAAEMDKAALPLANDTVAKEIVAVLLDQNPRASLRFTASDMSTMILARLGDDDSDEKSKDVYGARRIGKVLNRLNREFSTLFKWKSGTIEGRTRYEFEGLTRDGEIVYSGGLVDLQGKSPYVSERAGESFPPKSTDPTGSSDSPLRAGAGGGTPFSPQEGSISNVPESSSEAEGGDEPWWDL